MTKYMKYDNMIITIYFDNQTKYRLKRIDKGLKKI
ncbi:Not available [Clostridium perfringens]|nr:Not available [Clostridium perfringens]